MNREEAMGIINVIERHLANQGMTEEEYSLDEALVTLGVYKQPDPTTGLFPCGCGGAAHFWGSSGDESFYLVECEKCEIETIYYPTKKKAREAWNAAMGDVDV